MSNEGLKKLYRYNRIFKLRTSILIFTGILFSTVVYTSAAKGEVENEERKSNGIYIHLINFTMPVVKAYTNSEAMTAEDPSVKQKLIKLFGLDMNSPYTIVNKEIPILKTEINDDNHSYNTNSNEINPFKLENSEILNKEGGTENIPAAEEANLEDLPNKNVSVYDNKLKKTVKSAKPEVLIYHTHTSEAYAASEKEVQEILKNKKEVDTLDNNLNVCAVGDALMEELEKNYGISVIHDKTVHDAYSYNESYDRSSKTLDKYLKEYKDFKLIIDLHRDSVDSKKAVTTKMNGENVAKVMFVMAKKNPHFDKNMEVVKKLLESSNKLFPGFIRGDGVYYYNFGTKYFNQTKSNNAVLIEVGSQVSTTAEAKASAKYMARIIAEYINGKK